MSSWSLVCKLPYEEPMKDRTNDHRDVKHFVPADDPRNDRRPSRVIDDSTNAVGETTPYEQLDEGEAEASHKEHC